MFYRFVIRKSFHHPLSSLDGPLREYVKLKKKNKIANKINEKQMESSPSITF